MQRLARGATVVLVGIAAVAMVAAAVWLSRTRGGSAEPAHAGAIGKSIHWLAHQRRGGQLALALGAAGVGAAVVAVLTALGWRLAYLATAAGAVAAIGGVWLARAKMIALEDPQYADKSPYVHIADQAANVATAYLGVLFVVALIAYLVRRPDSGAGADAAEEPAGEP
jgi:hypothetical protein